MLSDNIEKATSAFTLAEKFLPSKYMLLLCKSRQKECRDLADTLIKNLLLTESNLYVNRKQGFIRGLDPPTIDFDDGNWMIPFKKYANYMEISSAILYLYEWLNHFEKVHGMLPRGLEFVDLSNMKKLSIGAWKLYERSKVTLENYKTNVTNRYLEKMEKQW